MTTTSIASCPICQQLASISAGAHPRYIATLDHCAVVLHDQQGQRGWCVLQLREHIEHLADLPLAVQQEVFGEVARVAGAVRAITGCRRINYECLGNVAAHVHWHVIPRYETDHDPRTPVWGFPPALLAANLEPNEESALTTSIREALTGPKATG